MFIRSIKVPSSSGVVHEYIRIVSSVRANGKVQQKVIANLGRRDTLEAVLPLLNRFLTGQENAQQLGRALGQDGPIEVVDASTWGPVLVVRHFFGQLGLWSLLDAGRRWPKLLPEEDPNDDWVSRVLVLIANRLTRPASEHGLAGWLETDYACDRAGSRYLPQWKPQRRVQVEWAQLQSWYRTLDHLLLNKDRLEVALFERLRTLFDFQPELVFYDLTSTYFEGHGPEDLAKHGHSRDGKPRNVQVVIGMVMVDGWPIAHHVWAGNTRDSTTVKTVIEDLTKRFRFRRIVFVGDRGMVTESNLASLQKQEAHGFLVGMMRRRNPEAEALIDRVDEGKWLDCPMGISVREKAEPPRTRVQEVSCDRAGVRVFVVDSDERRGYEERQRTKAMTRVRAALEKVQTRVAKGRLKQPAKIGAAVERVLQKNHGHRYYAWELRAGRLEISEHPVNLSREKKYEGKYLIQTDQTAMTPPEAVAHYKELSEVERGFRSLKDPLGMRPIWHHAARRVKAHIFVAALAFLIERMLERTLKEAGLSFSARTALEALQTIRHVQFRVDGDLRSGTTPGSARARQVLKALKLTEVRPPKPQKGRETRM
ncbi:MAG TPA: IS1634 family transposase [Pirellulales bacterium]|jgi:transposase|nr:IS1634 family transposase [Pirellulales bacterium]